LRLSILFAPLRELLWLLNISRKGAKRLPKLQRKLQNQDPAYKPIGNQSVAWTRGGRLSPRPAIYDSRFPIYHLAMTDENRKRIAMACRIFMILWFVGIALLEARYVISVFRQRPTIHHVLNTVYEEQIEGISFVLMIIFLIPGLFAWAVYRRFKRSY
jgi:hypothetical protein